MATRSPRGFGQYGGVARAVERVGERWALLIVRDLLAGARRYSDLKAGLPRIPTNILSDRLKELQLAGVIRRVPTVRGGYELTALGRGLEPVVLALERWGWAAPGDAADGDVFTADALGITLRAAFRSDVAAAFPPTEYLLHAGEASVSAVVAGGALDVMDVGPDALPQPQGRLSVGSTEDVLEFQVAVADLDRLLGGDVSPLEVLAGRSELVERFGSTFRFDPLPGMGVDAERSAA
ncbi:helix-turn-helix domain-containing protein [Leifsonia sp. fls2-241-R2A-40a]|uniref:winged helix-turn-helix transcriptional regulator n=1 Tax=Leifsonia sp. fls2-241-R2A-40a TaxID=3040290 RepID=UPI002551BC59|nr:helix-turn-helix domain-containing protein [Leifsonia sp. fls2-241-R2A-40a]